jgi:hypothetical protein
MTACINNIISIIIHPIYVIRLKIPDKIVAQNDVDFTFSISDSSGQPITYN